MVHWLNESAAVAPDALSMLSQGFQWMHKYSSHDGIAVARAVLALPRSNWTLDQAVRVPQECAEVEVIEQVVPHSAVQQLLATDASRILAVARV
ncbi:hypothetical protein GGF31_003293 [Allomyces arbusculus]|nr:hypothetical protein GGF31_003293 [Allomyces arbusculus]